MRNIINNGQARPCAHFPGPSARKDEKRRHEQECPGPGLRCRSFDNRSIAQRNGNPVAERPSCGRMRLRAQRQCRLAAGPDGTQRNGGRSAGNHIQDHRSRKNVSRYTDRRVAPGGGRLQDPPCARNAAGHPEDRRCPGVRICGVSRQNSGAGGIRHSRQDAMAAPARIGL